MNRRKAIGKLALVTGMAFLGSPSLLNASTIEKVKDFLDDADVRLLNEIGEIIIPVSADSPGAKAVNTGKFIQIVVRDCMSKQNRENFMQGWLYMQKLGKEKYHSEIGILSAKDKYAYLSGLDTYAKFSNDKDKSDSAIAAFKTIKDLTVKGYFTSEEGANQALRYDPVPGKFIGEIKYKKGDKVWALNM